MASLKSRSIAFTVTLVMITVLATTIIAAVTFRSYIRDSQDDRLTHSLTSIQRGIQQHLPRLEKKLAYFRDSRITDPVLNFDPGQKFTPEDLEGIFVYYPPVRQFFMEFGKNHGLHSYALYLYSDPEGKLPTDSVKTPFLHMTYLSGQDGMIVGSSSLIKWDPRNFLIRAPVQSTTTRFPRQLPPARSSSYRITPLGNRAGIQAQYPIASDTRPTQVSAVLVINKVLELNVEEEAADLGVQINLFDHRGIPIQGSIRLAELGMPVSTGRGISVISDLNGVQHYALTQPIVTDNEVLGYVAVSLPAQSVEESVFLVIEFLAITGLVIALLSVLLSVLTVRRFTRPITTLMEEFQAVSQGDLNQHIDVGRNDELGALARSFAVLRDAIKEKIEKLNEEIGERRKADDRLHELNESLELRVAERTAELLHSNHELEIARDAAESALVKLRVTQDNLIKSEKMASLGKLVAGVSHEINTPLGCSVTVASVIAESTRNFQQKLEACTPLSRSELSHYLETIGESAEILDRNLSSAADLIQNFRQVSVDQTSSGRRRFLLEQVLSEVLATLQPAIRKMPHTLELILNDSVQMDSYPGPLGQVLTNIVDNALVHAFENHKAGSVRVEMTRDIEENAVITITDNGRGIPDNIINKVFDPFFTTRMGAGGTGLGLSITYNIVTQLLGGNITVENTPSGGTAFRVVIPDKAPLYDTSENVLAIG